MRFFKSKYHPFLFVLTFLLFSCSDNTEELPSLDVETLKEYFPFSEYSNSDKVIFKHESGNERAFSIEHISTKSIMDNMGMPFESLKEEFILSPDDAVNNFSTSSNFTLELYSTFFEGEPKKQIMISQFEGNTARYTLTLDSLGFPSVGTPNGLGILNGFYEEVSLSTNTSTLDLEVGFYYNSRLGLIGYNDENDNFWLFERFE